MAERIWRPVLSSEEKLFRGKRMPRQILSSEEQERKGRVEKECQKGIRNHAAGKKKRNLDGADKTGRFYRSGIQIGSESGLCADYAKPWNGDGGADAPVSVRNGGCAL